MQGFCSYTDASPLCRPYYSNGYAATFMIQPQHDSKSNSISSFSSSFGSSTSNIASNACTASKFVPSEDVSADAGMKLWPGGHTVTSKLGKAFTKDVMQREVQFAFFPAFFGLL